MSEEIVVRVVASFDDQLGVKEGFEQLAGGTKFKDLLADLRKSIAVVKTPMATINKAIQQMLEVASGVMELKKRIETIINEFRRPVKIRKDKPEFITDINLILSEIRALEGIIVNSFRIAVKEVVNLFRTPSGRTAASLSEPTRVSPLPTALPVQKEPLKRVQKPPSPMAPKRPKTLPTAIATIDREIPRTIQNIHRIVRDTNNKIIKYVSGIRGMIPAPGLLTGVRKERLMPSLEPLIKEVRKGFRGSIRRLEKGKKLRKGSVERIQKIIPVIKEVKKVSEQIEKITKLDKEADIETRNEIQRLTMLIGDMLQAVVGGDVITGFQQLEQAQRMLELWEKRGF